MPMTQEHPYLVASIQHCEMSCLYAQSMIVRSHRGMLNQSAHLFMTSEV